MSTELDFQGVVANWQNAGEEHIHPLWNVDQAVYWQSGFHQATQAADFIPDGGRVLDFGAGNGRVSIPLAERGYQVTAVDSAPKRLAELTGYAERANVKIKTVESDGSDLAAKIRPKVDTVVCRAVFIHHAPEDIARLVGYLSGVIKKGGHLVVDWPTGPVEQTRGAWNQVTVMAPRHRLIVAQEAGLEPVIDNEDANAGMPSVWRKAR